MENTPENPQTVELPAPSPWPLVVALSLALILAGVLVSVKLTIAGAALAAIAAIGWWIQVIPGEKHELVAVAPEKSSVSPRDVDVEVIQFSAGRFLHHAGEMRPFTAAGRGGLVGGIAMAGVALLFGWLTQGSIWYPINLLAAGAVSDLANASMAQLREFSPVGLGVGIVIHGVTSLLVGLLYAVMLPMFPKRAFWWAGLLAPVLWSALIASLLGMINPTLYARIDWFWFVASQLAWGLTGGFVIARTQNIENLVNLPLLERAGIAAQIPEKDV